MPHSLDRIARRTLIKAGAAAAAAAALPSLAQSAWPKGTVRFIVPLAAGGIADITTRALAAELEKQIGQTVIVENRPGGLFTIGMQAIQAAPADGNTLIYLFNSIATVQAVHKKFDLNAQLIPVSQATVIPIVLLVPGNSPFRTLQDLVTYGRANPGKLNYSSLGPGSMEHLKSVQLERAAGFKANNISYKSGPDMVKDLIGGQVDFTITVSSFGSMYAPTGQVRVLGVFDDHRMKSMPDVPTIVEGGVKADPLTFWGGYAVKAGTPAPIVQRLHQELVKAALAKPVVDRLTPISVGAIASREPEDFRRLINADISWMAELAKTMDLSKLE